MVPDTTRNFTSGVVCVTVPETGEATTQTVTALIRPAPKPIWRLDARDADDETEVFEVTDDHPWYVEGAGWVETQYLRAGQHIETADDRGLTVFGIARTDRVEHTYNLTVSGPHTFLVGEDGAVVHNINCTEAYRLLMEHRQKLADYIRNPLAHDNRGLLARARTLEEAQTIYQGRIRALEAQIRGWQNELMRAMNRQ